MERPSLDAEHKEGELPITSVRIVLVNPQQEVYIVREAPDEENKWDDNDWKYTGGSVEKKDVSSIAAAIRETKEELGIELSPEQLIEAATLPNGDYARRRIYRVDYDEETMGRIVLGEGIEDGKWYPNDITPDCRYSKHIISATQAALAV